MNDEANTPMIFDLTNRPLTVEPVRLRSMLAAQANPQAFQLDFNRGARKPYRVEDGVAVISVSGPLFNGESRFVPNIRYKSLEKIFTSALADSEVDAVLFDLDSPGGEAGGMFDLSDAIYKARGSKPVWAIANEEAFSAAYGIASAAERIYVTRTGGVGSVGVIAVHVEFSEENKALGWNFTLFRGGKYKAEQNWIEPLTEHARDSIQTEVDRIYGMFVNTVARNRGVAPEKIRDTEANLYFGENGLQTGLADRIGSFERAMEDLKNVASRKKGISLMTDNAKNQADDAQNNANVRTEETPPAKQTTETPAATASNVDDIRRKANEEARADVQTVIDLCALAGKPGLAGDFVKEGLTSDQVRTKLLDVLADEGDRMQIDSRLNPYKTQQTTTEPKISASDIFAQRRAQMTGGK